MPGDMRVFLDDGYASQTTIPDVAVNDRFTCTLGADPELSIVRARTKRSRGDTPRSFVEHTERTTVTAHGDMNRSTKVIPALVVREAVPLSDDPRISVILKQPTGLAEAKGGEEVVMEDDVSASGRETQRRARWGKVVDGKDGEKAGVFEWVDPGETVTFVAEWEVRFPVSVTW